VSDDSGLDIGRRVKARRIAEAIRSLGGTAEDARKLSEPEWIMADKFSVERTGRGGPKRGQPWPVPSDVTRALVIEYLARGDAIKETSGCCSSDQLPGPRDEDVPG
jgi:hypothetical protein